MRVWFYYAVAPVVIVVATAVLLTIPYLALIAFAIVSLAALAALAWAIVFLPYMLAGGIRRRLHRRRDPSQRTAGAPRVFGQAYATSNAVNARLESASGQPTLRDGHVS